MSTKELQKWQSHAHYYRAMSASERNAVEGDALCDQRSYKKEVTAVLLPKIGDYFNDY
jgi:hypothetical protein